MRKFWLILGLVATLVAADQLVKEIAVRTLRDRAAVCVVPGVFNLAYVENRGCAWGMLQGQVWPLALFGVLALALAVWERAEIFPSARGGHALPGCVRFCSLAGEIMLYAGIVGNLIDRVCRGYVVDMFDFYWRESHFPCFNLADSFICLAAAAIVFVSFAQGRRT